MDDERKIAFLTLLDIEQKKAFSNLALNHHIAVGKPVSKAMVRRIVYGVLENRIYLDFIIGHYLKEPLEKLNANDHIVLLIGIYQLAFMDTIPSYAAVSETVNLAKKYCRGRSGFINAILRNYLRSGDDIVFPSREKDEVAYLSVKHSYAKWIVEMWLDKYGFEFTEELMEAGNRTPELSIRPNLLKTNKKKLERRLEERGYEVKDGHINRIALRVKGEDLLETNLYKDGMFSVQDESSMAAVDILDPKPGESVVDTCAAPGGKAMYIAEKMENVGIIEARDRYKRKLGLVAKEAERLGITIVNTNTWDAMIADSQLEETADKVMVDAPCSGLGVVRRKPEIKYKKWGDRGIKKLQDTQLRILSVSSQYVKRGGILQYCTCTINPAENEEIIAEFLRYSDYFIKEDEIQLLPNINDTDGFYICRMRRI